MDISIIIATCLRSSELRQTLASLAAIEIPSLWKCEVIVVDNAGDEATRQVALEVPNLRARLRYITEPRRGKSYALNAGVRHSIGKVLLFTDDDVRFPQDWLVVMASPILRGEFDGVAGGIVLHHQLEEPWMTFRHRDWLGTNLVVEGGSQRVAFPAGANFAVSRSAMSETSLFDTELGPGPDALGNAEDSLLARQIQKAFRILYQPQSPVIHACQEEKASNASFMNAAVNRGRSWAYVDYHWKHTSVRLPLLRLAKAHLKLSLLRIRRLLSATQGVAWDELSWVVRVSYLQQYIKESSRPRCYPKFGLKKLAGA